MLFDIQDNNNVNSFAVSRNRILHQALRKFCSVQLLKLLPLDITSTLIIHNHPPVQRFLFVDILFLCYKTDKLYLSHTYEY